MIIGRLYTLCMNLHYKYISFIIPIIILMIIIFLFFGKLYYLQNGKNFNFLIFYTNIEQ